jgi:hypothetical protein
VQILREDGGALFGGLQEVARRFTGELAAASDARYHQLLQVRFDHGSNFWRAGRYCCK